MIYNNSITFLKRKSKLALFISFIFFNSCTQKQNFFRVSDEEKYIKASKEIEEINFSEQNEIIPDWQDKKSIETQYLNTSASTSEKVISHKRKESSSYIGRYGGNIKPVDTLNINPKHLYHSITATKKELNSKAMRAFLTFFSAILFPPLIILSLIWAFKALKEFKNDPGTYWGKGFALFPIIYMALALLVIIVLIISI